MTKCKCDTPQHNKVSLCSDPRTVIDVYSIGRGCGFTLLHYYKKESGFHDRTSHAMVVLLRNQKAAHRQLVTTRTSRLLVLGRESGVFYVEKLEWQFYLRFSKLLHVLLR